MMEIDILYAHRGFPFTGKQLCNDGTLRPKWFPPLSLKKACHDIISDVIMLMMSPHL